MTQQEPYWSEVREEVEGIRVRLNLSWDDLAVHIGITARQLHRIRAGKTRSAQWATRRLIREFIQRNQEAK